jgi:hypothetical protein
LLIALEAHGSIRHKNGIKLAIAYRVLDNYKVKFKNSPIEPVTQSLSIYLVAIGIRSTSKFARGLGHLVLYFELSIARLEERVPEIALVDDSFLVAD